MGRIQVIGIGDDGKFELDDCLGNSKPLPDKLGIPARSENGCPNASQSFSTRALHIKKRIHNV